MQSDIKRRLAANQARRFEKMKLGLQTCIGEKFKVDKIDINFKAKIKE